MTENKIKAGVGVFVLRDGKFLVGLRMDLVVSCGPAFDPTKHRIEEETV